MDAKYSVKAASTLTGISTDTLRAWERRYAAVVPKRGETGRRYYCEADLSRLRLLREACELGHPIRLVAPQSDEALKQLIQSGTQAVREIGAGGGTILDRLLEAIDAFDATRFERILGHAAAGLESRALILEVILPLLNEVGDRWYQGRLSVAQEHMVSAELRNLVGTLVRLLPRERGGVAIVFATLSGERHEFGALLASLIAAGMGFHVHYLGPDTPPAEVAAAAGRTRSQIVALSCVRVSEEDQAAQLVRELRAHLDPRVEIWIGGHGAGRIAPRVPGEGIIFMEDLIDFERRLEMVRSKSATKSHP